MRAARECAHDAASGALRVAIDKIQELSTWNPPVLRDELAFLAEYDFELATLTGFSMAEIDSILNAPAGDPDDALPDLPAVAVTRPGDLWTFEGGHRLGCFDALEAASYDALMAGEQAGLAICDPSYNVPVAGHVTCRADAREVAPRDTAALRRSARGGATVGAQVTPPVRGRSKPVAARSVPARPGVLRWARSSDRQRVVGPHEVGVDARASRIGQPPATAASQATGHAVAAGVPLATGRARAAHRRLRADSREQDPR